MADYYEKDYLVSIIVPVFNEEDSIAPFMKELDRALEPIHDHLEIVFVNDGSRDNTVAEVNKVIAADSRVSLVNFSRNFGKEPALSAGLRVADGDFAVPMDVDLQDPPEVVLEFLKKYEEGDGKYDTVYGLPGRPQRGHRDEALLCGVVLPCVQLHELQNQDPGKCRRLPPD